MNYDSTTQNRSLRHTLSVVALGSKDYSTHLYALYSRNAKRLIPPTWLYTHPILTQP
jgi:hypothetical protein